MHVNDLVFSYLVFQVEVGVKPPVQRPLDQGGNRFGPRRWNELLSRSQAFDALDFGIRHNYYEL
jgi:hypothetical protein